MTRLLDFGPEWNPVLVVLAVLAILCVLALAHWWLAVAALVGLVVAAAVVTYL
jgi:hypothetical protein